MCMAVLFYTHQHLSSSSVIHCCSQSVCVCVCVCVCVSCASVCLHKSLFFFLVISVCIGECYFVSIITSVYVGEWCFSNITSLCLWLIFYSKWYLLSVNKFCSPQHLCCHGEFIFGAQQSTAGHSELHITGLNGKNVTLEAKNIAAISIFN
jgi:hypothetical protein